MFAIHEGHPYGDLNAHITDIDILRKTIISLRNVKLFSKPHFCESRGRPEQSPRSAPWVRATHLGLVVLQPVGLVHHQAGPLDGAQHRLVDGDQLIGGQQHVELDRRVFLFEHMDGGRRLIVHDR